MNIPTYKRIAGILCVALLAQPTLAITRNIEFPIDGPTTYYDNFLNDRDAGNRKHEGLDMFADKMTPLVAAVDGHIRWITEEEQSWGWALSIEDNEGWQYWYLHINNDTPGTDDGNGGFTYAFAPGMRRGATVYRGQHIAYVGDSGNAEYTAPHLHFEIHTPENTLINPFPSVEAASKLGSYDKDIESERSPTISIDKGLVTDPTRPYFCLSGSLIRAIDNSATYYCGEDGKRYVFPNRDVYDSWYDGDFSAVQTITATELAAIPIGGNVTYRPGSRLIKIISDPKVYAVGAGGILRWVTTEDIAVSLYGNMWAKAVRDVSDTLFINYTVGADITAP